MGMCTVYYCGPESTVTVEEGASLTIAVTDAPAAYDSVVIVFSNIRANINSVWFHMRQEPVRVDLLEWSNGKAFTLTSGEVPVGQCTQIRIEIDSAYIGINNEVHELKIPGGSASGLKLGPEFTIRDGINHKVIMDFDAEKSVVVQGPKKNPKGYLLKPRIRVLVDPQAGTISGTVLNPVKMPVAYAITGADTVTSSIVDTASGYFKLAFLPEDIYTVSVEDTSGRSYQQESVPVRLKRDTDLGEITLD